MSASFSFQQFDPIIAYLAAFIAEMPPGRDKTKSIMTLAFMAHVYPVEGTIEKYQVLLTSDLSYAGVSDDMAKDIRRTARRFVACLKPEAERAAYAARRKAAHEASIAAATIKPSDPVKPWESAAVSVSGSGGDAATVEWVSSTP